MNYQIEIARNHSDALRLINKNLLMQGIAGIATASITIMLQFNIAGLRKLCLRQEAKIKKLKHRMNEIHKTS
jgi:hypothetical protein